jgi:hypothetical protein
VGTQFSHVRPLGKRRLNRIEAVVGSCSGCEATAGQAKREANNAAGLLLPQSFLGCEDFDAFERALRLHDQKLQFRQKILLEKQSS